MTTDEREPKKSGPPPKSRELRNVKIAVRGYPTLKTYIDAEAKRTGLSGNDVVLRSVESSLGVLEEEFRSVLPLVDQLPEDGLTENLLKTSRTFNVGSFSSALQPDENDFVLLSGAPFLMAPDLRETIPDGTPLLMRLGLVAPGEAGLIRVTLESNQVLWDIRRHIEGVPTAMKFADGSEIPLGHIVKSDTAVAALRKVLIFKE